MTEMPYHNPGLEMFEVHVFFHVIIQEHLGEIHQGTRHVVFACHHIFLQQTKPMKKENVGDLTCASPWSQYSSTITLLSRTY